MIERLDMDEKFNSLEAAIHINRYCFVEKICKDKKILDISCGQGYGSYLMTKYGAKEVVGVDISEEAIEKANNNFKSDNLEFIVSNAEKLDCFKDNTFDMIVSFETIEHIPNMNKFLGELKRVAKKNATIIISCPNDYFYYPNDDEKNPFHLRKFTFEDFKKTCEKQFGKGSYYFGYSVDGYCNKKENSCLDIKQSNMIDYVSCDAKLLPNDKELLKNDASYYIGIYGKQIEIDETYTFFPIGMSDTVYSISKVKDKYIRELESYQKELIDYVKELETKVKDLNEKLDIVNEDKVKEDKGLVNKLKDFWRDL